METEKFDVAIVGAGPAGTSCAISLEGTGLKVALIDKSVFPRDKICGDALGIDVVNQLYRISKDLGFHFSTLENKLPSQGIKLFSPAQESLAIPIKKIPGKNRTAFVSPRIDFDNNLFQFAKNCKHVKCFQGFNISHIKTVNDGIELISEKITIKASIVIGADGAHSIVAKSLAQTEVNKKHYSAALRIYYEGITGFHEGNMVELHFIKDVIPGYLWIFPLPDNKANVGIGMVSSEVSKRKVNLKKVLQDVISSNPHFKERFHSARPLETIKGFGLPLGSIKRKISGDRFLLVGDAAGLIDPFSGEGVANAIRSGRIAAGHLKQCFEKNDFSVVFNKAYDKEIYHKMWREFRVSRLLQKLAKYPWLCNLVIRKANSNHYIRQSLNDALDNLEKRKSLFSKPGFYLSLLGIGGKKNEKAVS